MNVCEAEIMAIKDPSTLATALQALLSKFVYTNIAPTIVHNNSKATHDSLISEKLIEDIETCHHSSSVGT